VNDTGACFSSFILRGPKSKVCSRNIGYTQLFGENLPVFREQISISPLAQEGLHVVRIDDGAAKIDRKLEKRAGGWIARQTAWVRRVAMKQHNI
jgi:hypothetical protein